MSKFTFEDIEGYSLVDVSIHRYMQLYKAGELNWEDALIGMVCTLKQEKNAYQNIVVKSFEKYGPNILREQAQE